MDSHFETAGGKDFSTSTVNTSICRRGPARNFRPVFFEDHRRPAHKLTFKVNSHLDPIGDLNEGNAAVHSLILAVKGYSPCNVPFTCYPYLKA